MNRHLHLLPLLALLMLAACGGSGSSGPPPAPAVSLSPTSLSFGKVALNTASASQAITLTNSGTATLTISGISVTGTDAAVYAQTNTCGSSLAAQAHCSITVTFTPTAAASTSATISIASNAVGSPASVALSGTGAPNTPVVSLSSTALNFGNQTVNVSSANQTVTLTNTGIAPLNITSIALGGTDSGAYTLATTCGSVVAADATCTITVGFEPGAASTTSASVIITSDAVTSPDSVALSGTGVIATSANTLPITIDMGPPGITTANIAYATVTVCTPGSSSQCSTIDHIQVDTGSYGLRLFASEIGSVLPTPVTDGSGNPIRECVVYADGYTWGSLGKVDVTLGSRTISRVAIQVLSDSASGAPPNTCATTGGTSNGTYENTVASFGARGILGIGVFAQDCGEYCVQTPAHPQWYYICPGGTCSPAAVSLVNQIQNPLTLLATDNNGVVVDLPAVAAAGQNTLQGTIYFGVQTQANNDPTGATWYTLTGNGTLVTNYTAVGKNTVSSFTNSFVDLGSNGLFFADTGITGCTTAVGFYCPSSPLSLSATIVGANNAQVTTPFTVDNAETDFANFPSAAVYPHIAGNNSSPTAPTNAFDWGSPFYLGRKVYHLFENNTLGTIVAPAIAF